MIHTARAFEGYSINARDGALGSVKDIYFGDENWIVRHFVVETGSWLNGRRVLLAAARLTPDPGTQRLNIEATREQVRNSPPMETDRPVSRQREQEIYDHYGWPYYWGVAPLAGGGIAAGAMMAGPLGVGLAAAQREVDDVRTSTIEADRRPPGDPHLRSVREVRGYRISARDGELGHVEDLLIDTGTWEIRALVVDTRNWLPGRNVLVPPMAVEAVRWQKSDVVVDLLRDEIKNGPAFERHEVTADYTDRLGHYYSSLRSSRARGAEPGS